MPLKLIALLLACSALTGCCVSGTGCSGPTATAGAPIAWDGLGQPPTADNEQAAPAKPKRRTARYRDREIILGPLNDTAPRETAATSGAKSAYDAWTRLPNEDPEADARLKRQIKICQNC